MLLAGPLCRGDSDSTVGAAFLTAAGGKYYYEVEVLEAQGRLFVGFAGTNLGPQCTTLGGDACSWSFFMRNGDGYHRCTRGCGVCGFGY